MMVYGGLLSLNVNVNGQRQAALAVRWMYAPDADAQRARWFEARLALGVGLFDIVQHGFEPAGIGR